MTHVWIQPEGSSLCGQCCVAMLTGRGLLDVSDVMGNGRNYPRDMQRAFESFGHRMAKRSTKQFQAAGQAVAFVRCMVGDRLVSHWVCFDGERWIDPMCGVINGLPAEWRVSIYPVEKRASERANA